MNKINGLILFSILFSTTLYHEEIGDWFEDQIVFAKHGFEKKTVVGTVFQCSSLTSKKLAKKIPHYTQRDHTVRVLELGPGVGAVTKEIIEKLDFSKGDHFEVVEIEETFCKHLHKKFGYLEKQYPKNFIIHHQDAMKFEPSEKYDFIISTIPLNACPPTFVKALLKRLKNTFVKEDSQYGRFAFISYPKKVIDIYLKLFMKKENQANFKAAQKITKKFRKKYKTKTMFEVLNVPPGIQIYQVELNKEIEVAA